MKTRDIVAVAGGVVGILAGAFWQNGQGTAAVSCGVLSVLLFSGWALAWEIEKQKQTDKHSQDKPE